MKTLWTDEFEIQIEVQREPQTANGLYFGLARDSMRGETEAVIGYDWTGQADVEPGTISWYRVPTTTFSKPWFIKDEGWYFYWDKGQWKWRKDVVEENVELVDVDDGFLLDDYPDYETGGYEHEL